MKYIHVNKDEQYGEPIVVKVSSKMLKIIHQMSILANKHAQLDKLMVGEFAKINNISEEEASDIMCFNDFLVDTSQYGCDLFLPNEINLNEYKKIKAQNNEEI